jgi:hypothetical protein
LSIGKTLKKEKGKKIKEEILTGFSRNPQNDYVGCDSHASSAGSQ